MGSARVTVRVTYLQMLSREEARASASAPRDTALIRAEAASPEFGRFLYTAVGGAWYWRDRLAWTWEEWLARLERREVETWVLYSRGTPAGYFELEAQPKRCVQIIYFGLVPSFVGRGLGGYLLTEAVEQAWRMQPDVERVWVHTCSLDHPSALPNYLARGFTVFNEETTVLNLPDTPPGPWPGAKSPRP
jgi:GNAT superfamily N-acetyltransferase